MNLTMDMLEQMDSQDVFDVAALHMLHQGERGCDFSGHCLYRAPGNRRCAVGWLTPDSVYTPAMEHRRVRDLAIVFLGSSAGRRFAAFLCRHMTLLEELQFIHDSRDPASWCDYLGALAMRLGLRATVIRAQPEAVRRPPNVQFEWQAPVVITGLRVVPLSQLTLTEASRGREKCEETREAECA